MLDKTGQVYIACVRGSPNHWLVTFVTFVPMALPFLPFAPISLPMVPLVFKLVPMVQMLPTNGTIGEPRTHAWFVMQHWPWSSCKNLS